MRSFPQILGFLFLLSTPSRAALAQHLSDDTPVDPASKNAAVLNASQYQVSEPDRTSCAACNLGSGCDSMLCDGSRPLPLWTATADALFLKRSTPSSNELAFNTADQTQSLNANNFKFGVHTGFDLSLMRQISSDRAIELRYFGVDHWRSAFSSPTTPNDLLQINSAVPVFTFSGTGVDANYASALHNVEVNSRRTLNDYLTLISGFRYVELNEQLATSLNGSAIPFNYSAETRNRLYGFQLGGQARLLSRKSFMLDAFGKAGLFGNAAGQESSVSTGVVSLPANGRGSRTAFMGELGTAGVWQLSEYLSVRGGYRMLWLDGVALASDQLAASNFSSGTGFDGSGNVFYHGAFAGIQLNY
jgi:hypothetical protein